MRRRYVDAAGVCMVWACLVWQVSLKIMSGQYAPVDESDSHISADVWQLVTAVLSVDVTARPTLANLLDAPQLQPYLAGHANVLASFVPGDGRIATVEIPLIGYEGASKTKFSERCAC